MISDDHRQVLNPLVSVIIPCFNQVCFLPEALQSVLQQTTAHWECIIVNDGSPDNTAEEARQWVARDSRFRYVEKLNGGLSSARNRGLDEARGDFIQFLDADDVLKPTKLERQLQAATTRGKALTLLYCDYYRSPENDLNFAINNFYTPPRFLSDDPLKELILRWESELSIPIHCYLLDSRFFGEKRIRFDESLPNHEDFDLAIRILALKPDVVYIDEKLAVYRVHDKSMCVDRMSMRNGFLKAIDKQRAAFKCNQEIINALMTKRRECYNRYWDCSRGGRIKKRLNSFRKPLRSMLEQRVPLFWRCLDRVRKSRA